MNIAKIMIPKVMTAFLHDKNTVRQGLEVMTRYGYTAVPVLDDEDCYLGCVTEGDFLRHVMAVGSTQKHDHEHYRIGEIFRRDFCPAVDIDAPEEQVISAIWNQNFLPEVDGQGKLCGTVTRKSVISYHWEKTNR